MGLVLVTGGGGSVGISDECTATQGDILKGKTAISSDSDDEIVEGTLELTGNATKDHVLADKTFYSTDAKTKETGGIQSMAGGKKTPTTSQQTVSCAKKYMTSDIVIPGFTLPDASVIKKGTTVKIYDKSVVGTWEGYTPITTYFWNASQGGNVGGVVGTGSLGFGSSGQVYSNSNSTSGNTLSTPTMINLRRYSRIFVHINKSAPFESGGVAIYAKYSNGQRVLMRSFMHDSVDGATYYYDYNSSWWATLELVFTLQGTGLWQWGIQYIE